MFGSVINDVRHACGFAIRCTELSMAPVASDAQREVSELKLQATQMSRMLLNLQEQLKEVAR